MMHDLDETLIPYPTQHNQVKTGLYIVFGLGMAFVLIVGTLLLLLWG